METIKIVITFLGAVFGGFIGAAFKEFIADRFFHRNKKRELKSKLIKNIIVFFRVLKVHTDIYNASAVHKRSAGLLQIIKIDETLNKQQRIAIQKDISGIFLYTKDFHERDAKLFSEMTALESEIRSSIVECENYFKQAQYKQLRKSVWNIAKEGNHSTIIVKGYQDLDYDDLILFQKTKYDAELFKIGIQIDNRLEYFVNLVNEILS